MKPKGVMWHHTATGSNWTTQNLTKLLRDGRSGLRGPLCHLQLNRDGVFIVIASGRANHAGRGSWPGVRDGNSEFIGIEAANDGVGEPYSEAQIEAYIIGTAAILNHLGQRETWTVAHKEWAPNRKIDPRLDMNIQRSQVARAQDELKNPKPTHPDVRTYVEKFGKEIQKKEYPESSPIPDIRNMYQKKTEKPKVIPECTRKVFRYKDRGECVKQLQARLNELGSNVGSADGIFGSNTLRGVKDFQAKNGLTVDGIVGPKTWAKLV